MEAAARHDGSRCMMMGEKGTYPTPTAPPPNLIA